MSRKSGIVNVRMVITEEKILSNIDKVQKLINPKSKKQIVQLDDDTYFKDLIESIKAYLIEYPKKKNFPASVYKAAYGLVEYATIQFEENTKKVEELIRQREENIALAGTLRELVEAVENKDSEWKDKVEENNFYRLEKTFSITLNDTSWYNYNGITTFSSMEYERMAMLHHNLGINGNLINSYEFFLNTPVYNIMFDLKYLLGYIYDKDNYDNNLDKEI